MVVKRDADDNGGGDPENNGGNRIEEVTREAIILAMSSLVTVLRCLRWERSLPRRW
jgi:hypothetical protein